MKLIVMLFAALLAFSAQAAEYKVLGVVAGYTNATWSATTWKTLDKILFTGYTQSVKLFVEQGSLGADKVSGVTMPKVLTVPQTQPIGKCLWPNASLLTDQIKTAGYYLEDYDVLALVMRASSSGCNGGIATRFPYKKRDGTQAYVWVALSWSANVSTMAHEFIHTRNGVGHAKTIKCGTVPLGPQCGTTEYGNPTDIMGAKVWQLPIAPMRKSLGWTTPIVHKSGRATYTIGAAAAPGLLPSSIRVYPGPVINPRARVITQPQFWIEYRAPIGLDIRMADSRFISFADGAMLNVTGAWQYIRNDGTWSNYVTCGAGEATGCLMDMTPGDGLTYNRALLVGKSWTDPLTGTQIIVNSRTDTTLTVTVDTNN